MYFHMTLSYVGQLLDELSILWTLAVAYSFWYPKVYFPRCIKSRYDSFGHSSCLHEAVQTLQEWFQKTEIWASCSLQVVWLEWASLGLALLGTRRLLLFV